MRFILLLISLFFTTAYPKSVSNPDLAYRIRTLDEKNIIRINYDSNKVESYQYLMDDKYLKREVLSFYSSLLNTTILNRPYFTILKKDNSYYLD